MDAKSRADFINAVADSTVKVCPKCQTSNDPKAKFCETCGEKFELKAEKQDTNPFASVEPINTEKLSNEIQEEQKEAESVFAKGLPEWSIEPPQLMIRRKK